MAQPKPITESANSALGENSYGYGTTLERPVRVPASRDGQFVSLPHIFLTLGDKLSVAARYPDPNAGLLSMFEVSNPPRGSLSGMITTDGGGNVFTGGVMEGRVIMDGNVLGVSPCGRYRLVRKNPKNGEGWVIEVRTLENNKPLFRTGRFVLARLPFELGGENPRFQVSLVAPAGPLVICSGGGKYLQVVDFDIPSLAQQILPTEFHVTSQAAPCVMEGGSLDYQIQTNNPGAVARFKMRAETDGATLSTAGLLHFNAPKQVAAPTKVNFSIEIAGKDGNTVLHEFPVFVIPFPKDAPTQKPPSSGRVPI